MLGRSEVISHIIYVLSISFLWKLLCCARTRYEHFIWIDGFSSLTSGYSNCAKYDKNDTYKLDQSSLGCPKPQQLYIYIDFHFYVISEKSTGLACVLTLIWKYTELFLSLSKISTNFCCHDQFWKTKRFHSISTERGMTLKCKR